MRSRVNSRPIPHRVRSVAVQPRAVARWLLFGLLAVATVLVTVLTTRPAQAQPTSPEVEARIDELLARMTVAEKVGQMCLRGRSSRSKDDPSLLETEVRSGRIGAMLNVNDRAAVDRLQAVAVKESRLGIPLLFARDVIHGFRTIFPIPLAQAASFDTEMVEAAARVSAVEAHTFGIRWTFAPMVDIARDPRWGRIAESPGEDPYLAEQMAVAMIRGFQGDDLTAPDSLAACAKHFAAYGAAVGGRDYNSAPVPGALLNNVYLRPFAASVEAGAATFMTAFNEIDGIPATAHRELLRDVLRQRWGFSGFVVSDWESVTEMLAHGFSADAKHAAKQSALAGLDMEMTSTAFQDHLPELIESGAVPMAVIDEAVRNVLRVKMRLGLFERPTRNASQDDILLAPEHLELSRKLAQRSAVLLENSGVLPLDPAKVKVAVIGPLADAPHEQLGTWTFDGQKDDSQTPVAALRERLGDDRVFFAAGLDYSRSQERGEFAAARRAAEQADVVLFFGGEEAILSGEAHSRSDLRLPGAQEALLAELAQVGKPIVLISLSGRPNLLPTTPGIEAVLVAWHPGTMAGPALADLLLGDVGPSGRLPVTWPRSVGQIPIYYNHKMTGRPVPAEEQAFEDIPVGAWQSSLSNTSRYLDLPSSPAYPFGYGLTYTAFEYKDLQVEPAVVDASADATVTIRATLSNTGDRPGTEVVQLYTRDPVADVTRPVRELKGFERVTLAPGESRTVEFRLPIADLAFFDARGNTLAATGEIRVWVAPHARAGLEGRFEIANESAGESATGDQP